VGDYLLVFRSRQIELHYVPPFPDGDVKLIKHDSHFHHLRLNYQDAFFTGASISEPQPNPESVNDSRVIYILAYNMVDGFFYFRVTIYNSDYIPLGPRARMDVDILGVSMIERHLALGAWLGPEGKRGIWICRPLNELTRFVVAISFDQSCPAAVPVGSGDDLQELCELAPRIESTGKVLFVDTRDPRGK